MLNRWKKAIEINPNSYFSAYVNLGFFIFTVIAFFMLPEDERDLKKAKKWLKLAGEKIHPKSSRWSRFWVMYIGPKMNLTRL